MDNFFKILILILILNLILHLAILFYKNYAFVIEYITCTKSTWNPKKDRFKLFISILSFLATANFTYDMFKSVELSLWDLIIYLMLIFIFQFITIYVNFFSLEKNPSKDKESLLIFNRLSEGEAHKIYKDLINEKRATLDFNSVIEISKGNNLINKINWIDKIGMKASLNSRNKATTYGYIFDIFHENFIEGGIKNINGQKRAELLYFICNNFTKDGEKINKQNLDKSFCGWKPYEPIK